MKRSSRYVATYFLAATVGWGGVALWRIKQGNPPGMGGQRATRTDRAAVANEGTAEGIIARLEEAGEQTKKQNAKNGDSFEAFKARVAELRKTLPPAADRRAAFTACRKIPFSPIFKEYEINQEEVALATCRLIQWLESDPEAALAFLHTDEGGNNAANVAVNLWASEIPVEQALKRFKDKQAIGGFDGRMLDGASMSLGERADVQEFATVHGQLKGSMNELFVSSVLKNWPKEQLGELLPFASQSQNGRLYTRVLTAMSDRDAYQHVQSLIAAGTANEIAKFANPDGLMGKLGASTEIPFEERVALMEKLNLLKSGNPQDAANITRASVIRLESDNAMASGEAGSVLNGFREGSVSADEAMRQLSALMPDAARYASEDLKQRLTAQLIKSDPIQGLSLLDDLPPDERYRTVNTIAKNFLSTEDPQKLYDLFQAVPFDPAQGNLQERFQVWTKTVSHAYGMYDDSFVGWVKNLPQGRDRDMALSALALKFDTTNPAKAAELRALKTLSPKNNQPASSR